MTGQTRAGRLLAVLGLELEPAAGGGMGMTEDPAGPERLETGTSETNEGKVSQLILNNFFF